MARAGKFRDRLTVERQGDSGALDIYGNPAAAVWQKLAPVGEFWGDLRETTGKERLAAGRLEAPATATLRLRRSPETAAIEAADRVIARGAVWAIVSAPVDPDGRGRLVEFTLERGGAVE